MEENNCLNPVFAGFTIADLEVVRTTMMRKIEDLERFEDTLASQLKEEEDFYQAVENEIDSRIFNLQQLWDSTRDDV